MSVECGQLVNPLRIGIRIGVARNQFLDIVIIVLYSKNIAVRVVSIFITINTFHHSDELILCIVSVTDGQITASIDDRNITQIIIRIRVRIYRGTVHFRSVSRNLGSGSVI